jgi:energy-coupling factor transporter ATP-binding protein EcfA2
MKTTVTVSSRINQTPRILQAGTMFDHPPSEHMERTWQVNLPIEDKPWSVGLIVGPSGAGKSTIVRECFKVRPDPKWVPTVSILDSFPYGAPGPNLPTEWGIRDIVDLLTSVGLGSTPAWLRAYETLSTGEQFRAMCARRLAETPEGEVVVIDEFTSVVDRQVAQVASNALQKTVRRTNRQLVAVTCHYDVVDWLQPDWIYQPHADKFDWRSVQPRPGLDVGIYPIHNSAWRVFAPHHYLSAYHQPAAHCFGAFINGECIGFVSYRHLQHPNLPGMKVGHRLVVLPDWQGLGIGNLLNETIAEMLYRQGLRFRAVVAHPAMIRVLARSPRWQLVAHATKPQDLRSKSKVPRWQASQSSPRRFNTYSFEYRPEAKEHKTTDIQMSKVSNPI